MRTVTNTPAETTRARRVSRSVDAAPGVSELGTCGERAARSASMVTMIQIAPPAPSIHHHRWAMARASGEAGEKTECIAQGCPGETPEFFGLALGVCAGAGLTIMLSSRDGRAPFGVSPLSERT